MESSKETPPLSRLACCFRVNEWNSPQHTKLLLPDWPMTAPIYTHSFHFYLPFQHFQEKVIPKISSVLITQRYSRQMPTPSKSSSTRTYASPSSINMVTRLMAFFRVLLVLSCLVAAFSSSCNQLDKESLLAFSSNISTLSSHPPLNWSTSVDCCSWEGILCDEGNTDNGHRRVIGLLLPSRGLAGSISPSLMKLTCLSRLNLSHNRLSGNLPTQFFSLLNHLQILDLSHNYLSDELPTFDINNTNTSSTIIQELDLSSNLFQGTLPSSFLKFLKAAAAARTLAYFNVSENGFIGPIPISQLCINKTNSSIRFLDLSSNHFNGSIQPGLGACSKLEIFRAGFNSLSGPLPGALFDAVSLREISLPLNQLSGNIDDGISTLTNLTVLELYSNDFRGSIPQGIGKLSKLEKLLLHINNLTGTLPPSLVNCVNLVVLNLRVNLLAGNLGEFNFSGFQRLTKLDLGNNNFTGNLPKTLYACKSLAAVRLTSNQLEGQITPDILGLKSLSFLALSANSLRNFTGAMRILAGLKDLSSLVLSKNFYNETIPYDENLVGRDGYQKLQVLALGGCNFTGQIPGWLARLRTLEVIDMSYNLISGSIPPWLGKLPRLFYLDLSHNQLTGVFPTELTGFPALTSQQANDRIVRSYLELPVFIVPNNASQQQYNQLSNLPPAIYMRNNSLLGNIPQEIGLLKVLHQLDLGNNNFSGSIPVQISNLTNLEKLDLSGNRLSGEIPASLKSLHFLSFFTVANNDLQGEIPTGGQFHTFPPSSFAGNPQLCGSAIQRSCYSPSGNRTTLNQKTKWNQSKIIGTVIALSFAAVCIIIVFAIWILFKRRIAPRGDPDETEQESTFVTYNNGFHPEVDKKASPVILFPNKTSEIKDLTISEILKATKNFSLANIIGSEDCGLVYRATLPDGNKLAIKKLTGESRLTKREFRAEVEALSIAQHENLVAVQGYCVHDGFRLLIYSFMENGSLDYWLHEKPDGATQLDWPTRLKIAQGVSCGLAYMHHTCVPHIVHRNIKPSNILLDENFDALVANFGLSRLILPSRTHVTTEVVGTLGYIPPEYGQASEATLRGDVYSFGVLLLELLSGRRPLDMCKTNMSMELVLWMQQMMSEGKEDQVFDPLLTGKGFEDEMLQVLHVACMCVSHNPFKRPNIREVVDWLKNVGSAKQHHNED
ncbi:tyrosine-sulfated glycopeptide receptor 1-like [Neltuma alba]|uniref:tyrosine-sulfated glycopeptide receptor 1-like n=1 Tax=Neltuma alba TaxID=207710 RepID=UPI0010A4DCC9|nr:tyrosine-sulfated glycopeptide receptor 1-like [Prosopis alba]